MRLIVQRSFQAETQPPPTPRKLNGENVLKQGHLFALWLGKTNIQSLFSLPPLLLTKILKAGKMRTAGERGEGGEKEQGRGKERKEKRERKNEGKMGRKKSKKMRRQKNRAWGPDPSLIYPAVNQE